MKELIEREPLQWTSGKLGMKFGVSRQQIAKDIKDLKNWGNPIQNQR